MPTNRRSLFMYISYLSPANCWVGAPKLPTKLPKSDFLIQTTYLLCQSDESLQIKSQFVSAGGMILTARRFSTEPKVRGKRSSAVDFRNSPILAIGYLIHVCFAHSWLDCRCDHDSVSPICHRFFVPTSGNAKFQNQINPSCRPSERTRRTPLERSQAIAVPETKSLIAKLPPRIGRRFLS